MKRELIFPFSFGVFILFMGLGLILFSLYLAGQTVLTCQRVESTQIDCTLTYWRWLGQVNVGTEPVNRLEGARRVVSQCTYKDSEGRQRTRSCEGLALLTAGGEVPVELASTDAEAINTFVNSDQPVLTLTHSYWLFSVIMACFGGLALFMGGFLIRWSWGERIPRWRQRRRRWS